MENRRKKLFLNLYNFVNIDRKRYIQIQKIVVN